MRIELSASFESNAFTNLGETPEVAFGIRIAPGPGYETWFRKSVRITFGLFPLRFGVNHIWKLRPRDGA